MQGAFCPFIATEVEKRTPVGGGVFDPHLRPLLRVRQLSVAASPLCVKSPSVLDLLTSFPFVLIGR